MKTTRRIDHYLGIVLLGLMLLLGDGGMRWLTAKSAAAPVVPTQKLIKTEELALVDADGVVKARLWCVDGKRPYLSFSSSPSNTVIMLGITEDGLPSLSMWDSRGKIRGTFGLSGSGKADFSIFDTKERIRLISTTLNDDSGGQISFVGQDGRILKTITESSVADRETSD